MVERCFRSINFRSSFQLELEKNVLCTFETYTHFGQVTVFFSYLQSLYWCSFQFPYINLLTCWHVEIGKLRVDVGESHVDVVSCVFMLVTSVMTLVSHVLVLARNKLPLDSHLSTLESHAVLILGFSDVLTLVSFVMTLVSRVLTLVSQDVLMLGFSCFWRWSHCYPNPKYISPETH
jgi:hypothetical protein